jgi:hypothetical protein
MKLTKSQLKEMVKEAVREQIKRNSRLIPDVDKESLGDELADFLYSKHLLAAAQNPNTKERLIRSFSAVLSTAKSKKEQRQLWMEMKAIAEAAIKRALRRIMEYEKESLRDDVMGNIFVEIGNKVGHHHE